MKNACNLIEQKCLDIKETKLIGSFLFELILSLILEYFQNVLQQFREKFDILGRI